MPANSDSAFSAQMERIKLVTGKYTQAALADFLGVRQSSVSDAKRRGKIPADWLVTILRTKGVHPEWILTGLGPRHIRIAEPGVYETGDIVQECLTEKDALQSLSSRALADELVRRVALAQADGFTRREPGLSS